ADLEKHRPWSDGSSHRLNAAREWCRALRESGNRQRRSDGAPRDVYEQCSVAPYVGKGAQHTSVAINLDGYTQTPERIPHRGIPRHGQDREKQAGRQATIVCAEMLLLMPKHQGTLVGRESKRPARKHDPRLEESHDRRTDVVRHEH